MTTDLKEKYMAVDNVKNQDALDIHNNMLQAWESLSKSDDVDLIKTNQSILTVTSIPDALFNTVLEANFSHKDDCIERDTQIRKIDDMYRSKNLSYCWWVPSFSSADNLGNSLFSCGLTLFGKVTGMVLELNNSFSKDLNSNKNTVSFVTEVEDYDLWIQPLEESFHMSPAGANCYRNIYSIQSDNQNWCNIMAKKSQQPIASCSLFFDQSTGLVGIYNCATIGKERRKGVMSSLIIQALQTAYERGFKRIVLQSSPDSCSMFKKLGFVEASSYDVFLGNDNSVE